MKREINCFRLRNYNLAWPILLTAMIVWSLSSFVFADTNTALNCVTNLKPISKKLACSNEALNAPSAGADYVKSGAISELQKLIKNMENVFNSNGEINADGSGKLKTDLAALSGSQNTINGSVKTDLTQIKTAWDPFYKASQKTFQSTIPNLINASNSALAEVDNQFKIVDNEKKQIQPGDTDKINSALTVIDNNKAPGLKASLTKQYLDPLKNELKAIGNTETALSTCRTIQESFLPAISCDSSGKGICFILQQDLSGIDASLSSIVNHMSTSNEKQVVSDFIDKVATILGNAKNIYNPALQNQSNSLQQVCSSSTSFASQKQRSVSFMKTLPGEGDPMEIKPLNDNSSGGSNN